MNVTVDVVEDVLAVYLSHPFLYRLLHGLPLDPAQTLDAGRAEEWTKILDK
jgi:hypothetical protein